MAGTFSPSIRIGRPLPTTNSGAAPANASGFTLGQNFCAVTVSQELYVFNPALAATGGALPWYDVGVGGTAYVAGAVSIPNVNVASAQVIGTLPAGSRLQNIDLNLLQAPTAITGGVLTISLNGTPIGTFTIGTGIGNAPIAWQTTLQSLRLVGYVGLTDAIVTANISGSGITGGILAELSFLLTARSPDGAVRAQGSGLTNSGANAPIS